MSFELDHVYVLTEPGAPAAERLTALGFSEGEPNTHPGQGTANRRFFFSNCMLELLWVRDPVEAAKAPTDRFRFTERTLRTEASPFGLIFRPRDEAGSGLPFPGWRYEPEYLDPPYYLHIGANSERLGEPICVFFPFGAPRVGSSSTRSSRSVSEVRVSSPVDNPSEVFTNAALLSGVTLQRGPSHLMEIRFEGHVSRTLDMRPHLPLVLYT